MPELIAAGSRSWSILMVNESTRSLVRRTVALSIKRAAETHFLLRRCEREQRCAVTETSYHQASRKSHLARVLRFRVRSSCRDRAWSKHRVRRILWPGGQPKRDADQVGSSNGSTAVHVLQSARAQLLASGGSSAYGTAGHLLGPRGGPSCSRRSDGSSRLPLQSRSAPARWRPRSCRGCSSDTIVGSVTCSGCRPKYSPHVMSSSRHRV